MNAKDRKPEFYTLEPSYPSPPGAIMNASCGFCGLCGTMVTGMGGSNNQICLRCAEVVLRGQAKIAIVWDENDTSGASQ